MTADDIERRLRALPELSHAELEDKVAARAAAPFARAAASSDVPAAATAPALLSAALIATVLAYVGWAIDFAIALYR